MSDKQYMTPDDFLIGTLGQAVDLDVPPLGTVRVRGLSVGEVAEIRRLSRNDGALLLAHTIAVGLVEPQMTPELLLAAPAGIVGVYETIGVRIAELSGLSDNREQQDAFLGGGS